MQHSSYYPTHSSCVSFFPELVSILKRVSSSSKIVRSNTASPVKVVSDSSGCSLKVENKCGKHKIAHRCNDKNISAPTFANEGVTVETVDKRVKFGLKNQKISLRRMTLTRATPQNQSQ